jgi:hypothetical protein
MRIFSTLVPTFPAHRLVEIPRTIKIAIIYIKEYFVFMGLPPIGGEIPPKVRPGRQSRFQE